MELSIPKTNLSDPSMKPKQLQLPLQVRVDLEVMTIKGYSQSCRTWVSPSDAV